jgi:xanthine dehydrogenase accessory factor
VITAELRATALHWLAEGRPAVVVEVLRTQGSVPREAGTRMLVSADGVQGTIGGGHLEWQAIADARALLARGAGAGASPEQRIALGPSLGQCCGGALTLRFQALSDSAPAAWPQVAPRFHLQLYGAGHVARAIVALLEGLPCRVSWIDERESEFPRGLLPPHIERRCVEPVEVEVTTAPPGAFHLVLTHSHGLDLALTQAILARGDFGWFGLIGSRTKRVRFERRLRERGFDAALVDRITCPIGLPGISGKEPEVIAVAVVAQMLQAADAAPGTGSAASLSRV